MRESVAVLPRLFTIGAVAAVVLLSIVTVTPAAAQFQRGTVVGTVTDETGGVIANAKVTLKNLGTNEERSVTTDERGDYTFPSLLPGAYSVTAESAGFKTQVISNIQLQVNQTARIDLRLSVGQVVERVEATASLQLLKTDTSDIGSVIANKQIVDLPLNGRDYLQLARLLPGAIPSRAGATAGQKGVSRSVNVAGARDTSISYLLDGVDTNDLAFQTPTVTPSVDAIQEFKLLANAYSAEFGHGSTQVIAALKSGTNDPHGSLFEFNRNNKFAARTFFQPGSVARLNYNQFGGTFGGPVHLPKIYSGRDKTFFFLSYEGSRQRSGATNFTYVPTDAMKSGDFSAAGSPVIYDPTTWDAASRTRQPFSGNRVPSTRINSVAPKVTALWPSPNYTGLVGRNYAGKVPGIDDNNGANLRFDHRISNSDNFFARYSISDRFRPQYGTLPLTGIIDEVRGQNLALNWVHIFTPTLLNEVRAGFNRAKYFTVPDGSMGENPARDTFGFKNTTANPSIAYGLPLFTFSGGWASVGHGNQYPANSVTQTYQYVDNLTWVRSAHTFKTGFDLRRTRLTAYVGGTARGQANFTGQYTNLPNVSNTGSSIADLLLGIPQSIASAAGDQVAHNYVNMYSLYFQDDWKVSSRLTLNLGVRYEYTTPYVEKLDRFVVLDLNDHAGGRLLMANSTKAYVPGKGVVDTGGPMTSRSLVPPDKNNWAPRVGFAYRPIDKTVVRGGYGVFYDVQEGNEAQFLRNNPPYFFGQNLAGDTFVPSFQLDNLFPSPTGPTGTIQPFTVDPNMRVPYMQQWNLAIEREIVSNLVWEVGYVGSAGKKLLRRSNFQQGSKILVTDTANPLPLAQRVDFPLFSNNYIVSTDNGGSSTYHGLLTKVERRFANGFALLFSYTFGRAISDSHSSSNFDNTPSNPQCRCDFRAEKGLSAYHIQQRAVVSYAYELPFGKGKAFLNEGGIANKIVGGWQINGITAMQTGPPFTLATSGDNAAIGSSAQRPNVVADPYAGIDTGAAYQRRGVDSGTYYFNTASFAMPPLFRLGSVGKNTLIAPGLQNWDFSVFKNTSVNERLMTQFRAEFFSLFNHPNFGIPGRTMPSSSFGVITGTASTSGARLIQFGLKLVF